MELPTELWHLIIECYDLNVYKSCILVNKTFNKIIKKIIKSIPKTIEIIPEETDDNIVCDKCEMRARKTNHDIICVGCERNQRICSKCGFYGKHYPHYPCDPINETDNNELYIDSSRFMNHKDYWDKDPVNAVIIKSKKLKTIVHKHDLLLSRYIHIKSMLTTFPLPINTVLRNKKEIVIMKYKKSPALHYWFCYC